MMLSRTLRFLSSNSATFGVAGLSSSGCVVRARSFSPLPPLLPASFSVAGSTFFLFSFCLAASCFCWVGPATGFGGSGGGSSCSRDSRYEPVIDRSPGHT